MAGCATQLLNVVIRVVASAMVLAIFLITLVQVVLRYLFSITLPWSSEAAQVLLVYTVMLVAAYAVGHGAHFTVRSLFDSLPLRVRKGLVRLHSLLVLAFAGVAVFYGTRFALEQMDARLPALGLPVGMVYAALPLGGVLMCLYALAELVAPVRLAEE